MMLIFSAILFISSCAQKEQLHTDLWAFHIGQTTDEVKRNLDNLNYSYNQADSLGMTVIGTENTSVNYLGIDWDVASVIIQNDTVSAVMFSRISPLLDKSETIDSVKLQSLKTAISSQLGEMKEDRGTRTDEITRIYVWNNNSTNAELITISEGDAMMLSYYNNRSKPTVLP